MALNLLTEIQHASHDTPLPSDDEIQTWARIALDERVPEDSECCIRLVDKAEIQSLNRTYRSQDKPTNVLSFPADLPEGLPLSLLGDIVICPAVVLEEAIAQNKPYPHHFAHMVVHGCLHLLGYDHVTPEQADIMEPLEVDILASIPIPNPYARDKTE